MDKLDTNIIVKNPDINTQQELLSLVETGPKELLFLKLNDLSSTYSNSPFLVQIKGLILAKNGETERAQKYLGQAEKVCQELENIYFNQGTNLLENKQFDQALEYLIEANRLNPNNPKILANAGLAFEKTHRYESAIISYTAALKLEPNNFEALNNIANLQIKLSRPRDAIQNALTLISNYPSHVAGYMLTAQVYSQIGKLNDALKYYTAAYDLAPENAEVVLAAAIFHMQAGDTSAARDILSPLALNNSDNAKLNRIYGLTVRYHSEHPHFRHLLNIEQDKSYDIEELSQIRFAIAKAYEDQKDLEKSFEYLQSANALKASALEYDLTDDVKIFDKMRAYNDQLKELEFTATYRKGPFIPIFIVGMPRSGTTLTERIFGCHPEISNAGELSMISDYFSKVYAREEYISQQTIEDLRNYYFQYSSIYSDGSKYMTDKMPQNFLFIPLIKRAFPEAKIIHTRRKKEAVCWSNFKNYFDNNGMGYCYNWKTTLEYYDLYQAFVEEVSNETECSVIECDYDELCSNPEKSIEKLIYSIGVEWSPLCLYPEKNRNAIKTASLQQADKPIYKDSSRHWEAYKHLLGSTQ